MIPNTPTRSQAPPLRPVSDKSTDQTVQAPGPIVRPRFFAGQLLTDVSLSGLTDWARSRFGLVRYRDGWGVVCGLDVWSPAENRATLAIGPGYAISCPGDDLLLDKALTFDLTKISQGPPAVADWGAQLQIGYVPGKTPSMSTPVTLDPVLSVPLDEIRIFDLYLRALESPCVPQPSPRRGSSCTDATGCDFTQLHEDVELVALPAPVTSMARTPFDTWVDGFKTWSDDVNKFLGLMTFNGDGTLTDPAAKALIARLKTGVRHFPFLLDRVIQKPADKAPLTAITWLVLDERQSQLEKLSRECPGCESSSGVPLARVWLRVTATAGKPACQILAVSNDMPYRRPFHKEDRWPAPTLGGTNLGRLIGARWGLDGFDVRSQLFTLGINCSHADHEPFKPSNLTDIISLTRIDSNNSSGLFPFPKWGDFVKTMLFGELPHDSPFVVGFRV